MKSAKKVPFTILDILIISIAYITLSYTFNYAMVFTFINVFPYSVITILSYLAQVSILLLILVLLNKKYKFKDYSLIGFKKFSLKKAISLAVYSYISYLSIMILLLYSTMKYKYYIPGIGEQQEHIGIFGEGIIGVIILGIIAIIVAPVTEELLFRGYILTTLNKYYSTSAAIIVSSIFFAAVHLEFQVFIPLFVLGLILGYLRTSNDNIFYSIVFHILNNSIAFIVEILIKF